MYFFIICINKYEQYIFFSNIDAMKYLLLMYADKIYKAMSFHSSFFCLIGIHQLHNNVKVCHA